MHLPAALIAALLLTLAACAAPAQKLDVMKNRSSRVQTTVSHGARRQQQNVAASILGNALESTPATNNINHLAFIQSFIPMDPQFAPQPHAKGWESACQPFALFLTGETQKVRADQSGQCAYTVAKLLCIAEHKFFAARAAWSTGTVTCPR